MIQRRCVFLDRDGVINVKPADGHYVRSWEEFRFVPEIVNWIRLFNALNLLVIVVTNQRGVAQGIVSLEDLEKIHSNMRAELAQAGAHIDDVLYCPHAEGECQCRKPLPGLVEEAGRRWNLDLRESLLIGDSESDRELARNCGMRFVLVRGGRILDTVRQQLAAAL